MTDILLQGENLRQADDVRTALAALWPEARFHLDPAQPHDLVLSLGKKPETAERPTLWLIGPDASLDDAGMDGVSRLPAPARLIQVLHRLKELAARPPVYVWQGHVLDTAARSWQSPGDAGGIARKADLTEKEVALLVYLGRQYPRPAGRDDLLRDVWNYASGADTHTVETHLYRLRQKIEADPDRPTIIVNTGDGYILGVLA